MDQCETPIWVKPIALFSLKIAPTTVCPSSAVNAFIRGTIFILLLTMIMSIWLDSAGLFSLAIIVLTVFYAPSLYETLFATKKEGFQAPLYATMPDPPNDSPQETPATFNPSKKTRPTAHNPFMNVLIDEIKYNPTRPSAENVNDPLVKTELQDFFKIQWFNDPTDVFGRSQSQRQFYTMPSTSIPNDQGSYQDWLYKIPGKTCKEGGACLPGSDGGALPWLNADR